MSFFRRLFHFRIFKFRTTLAEELEDLHTESQHLRQALIETRLHQRKWRKWFAIYAIAGYILCNLAFYFLFLPKDYLHRTYAALSSILLGFILYGIYWFVSWCFRTSIKMKEDRIELFKDRKKELIDEVKKKETYAVAEKLLEKYGETVPQEIPIPSATAPTIDTTNRDLRQRVTIKPTTATNSLKSSGSATPQPPHNIGHLETVNPPATGTTGANPGAPAAPPGKLPRPILPPQQTFLDSILSLIVGDGPSKRYALICKSCYSHNGMALAEEFEYIPFRCAYCNYFNKARKEKPVFHGSITNNDAEPSTTASPPITTTATNRVDSAEISSSDSSDSLPSREESNPGRSSPVTRRSIRVLDQDEKDESRSRSTSAARKSPSTNENLS